MNGRQMLGKWLVNDGQWVVSGLLAVGLWLVCDGQLCLVNDYWLAGHSQSISGALPQHEKVEVSLREKIQIWSLVSIQSIAVGFPQILSQPS